MTGGLDLGYRGSIRVDYEQLQEVCWTTNLSLPTSVVNLIHLEVLFFLALSDCALVNTRIGAREATLET